MRQPWFLRSYSARSPRSHRRRGRFAGDLRVRQLERRRVLDAAIHSLVVTPSVATDTATSVATDANPLVFDWSVTDNETAAAADANQASSQGEPEMPVGMPDEEPFNVSPVLTVAPNQTVGEGQLLNLSGVNAPPLGLFIDDGGPDSHTVTVNWGDSPENEELDFFFADGSGAIVGTHTYAFEGLYEVRVTVVDSGGLSAMESFFVNVKNVPPGLTVAPDQMVNEGALLNLSGIGAPPLGLIVDDGKLDTHTATIDWGDGTLEPGTVLQGMGSATIVGTHTYLENGVYEVKVRAFDNDGDASPIESFFVTVKNTPPGLTVAADQMVNEGALLNLSGVGAPPLGLIVDDGKLDTHTATIDWGDGTVEPGSVLQGMGSATIVGTHTYLENGVYEVKVRAFDDDGDASPIESFFVTVKNTPPGLTVAADQMVNEGALLNLSGVGTPPLGLIVDDGKLDTHTATIDWGDGTVETAMIQQGMGSAAIVGTHVYVENGVYEVKVRARDDDGDFSAIESFFVTVKNVPPVLTVAQDQMVNESQPLNLSGVGAPPLGLIVDDGKLDTHTAVIDWGDGNVEPGTVLQGMGSAAIVATHTYADDGVYEVKVRARDDDGDFSETQSFFVTVKNVVPSLANIDNLEVKEGSAFTLIGLEVHLTDPGFDNPANPIVGGEKQEKFVAHSINWGDGTPIDMTISIVNRDSGSPGVPTTAQFSHAAHTYADDGDYTVTIRVADDDMGAFENPARFTEGVAGADFVDLVFTIRVKNEKPSFTRVPSATTINESEGISFTAEFSDPGFDNPLNPNAPDPERMIADPRHESFTYDIDWGDGRQELEAVAVADVNGSVGDPSTGMFGGSHVYADDGLYTVTLTIRDDNGGVRVSTFLVNVQNVSPSFVPTPLGASFAGDDISSEGITTIRVAFNDPGFDNPANPNPASPPSITDTRHESFTHVLNWGDGTIDAVHTYPESGVYTVSVTQIGPGGGMQIFSFPNVDSSLRPVLTLVSSQALNNPAVPEQTFTYFIRWGDGVVQTAPLALKAPGNPVMSTGLTRVLGLQRSSGGETTLTTGSFQVQHRYLGPPNPLNPTADIRIDVAVLDDNNGSVSDFILVDNPGIQTAAVAIDTTPAVPTLEFTPPPVTDVFIDEQIASTQSQQSSSARVVRSDMMVTSERYLELVVLSPDGKVVSRHRIRDEALNDLRSFFATLPDGHYQVFLVRTENNSRRLIMDVYVRNGRVIDPADETEGTRDRPPSAEESPPARPLPLEENRLLEPLPRQPNGGPEQNAAPIPQAGQDRGLPHDTRPEDEPLVVSLLPLRHSPRWVVPLAALSLAARGTGWSQQMRTALENADDRVWQRLRSAGQLARPKGKPNSPPIPPSSSYNTR